MTEKLSKEQNELEKLDSEFLVLSNQHYELVKELNIVTDKLTEVRTRISELKEKENFNVKN